MAGKGGRQGQTLEQEHNTKIKLLSWDDRVVAVLHIGAVVPHTTGATA
jgi:hypothetical protein